MEPDSQRYWQAYIDELRQHMELRDWEIGLGEGDTDPLAAHCEPVVGRKKATIRVCSDWEARTPEENRQTLVHELLHCHFYPLLYLVRDGIVPEILGRPAAALLIDATEQALEYGLDATAEALADGMPLPGGPDMSEADLVRLFDGDSTPEQEEQPLQAPPGPHDMVPVDPGVEQPE